MHLRNPELEGHCKGLNQGPKCFSDSRKYCFYLSLSRSSLLLFPWLPAFFTSPGAEDGCLRVAWFVLHPDFQPLQTLTTVLINPNFILLWPSLLCLTWERHCMIVINYERLELLKVLNSSKTFISGSPGSSQTYRALRRFWGLTL